MYNKYFTMKRSELKEAIKAEITSVLSEQSNNPNFDKKVASFAKKINNEMDYPGGVLEAMKQIKSRLERIISKVEDAKRGGAEEEPLMKMIGLKEAIKAEIKSVLSEEIQVGDIVTLGGDGDELEVIDKRRMFGSDMMAYRVKKVDGTKFNANVDFPEIGDETAEYSGDQLRPARMMNEGKRGVVVDPDEIKFHLDQFYGGNIDGNDLANAIEEILSDMMKRSVSFADIREEDEAPAGDKETEKAARGKDKVTIDFRNVMKKYNELKEKDKKEAVEYLKSNQDIVKKYKKAKEVNI